MDEACEAVGGNGASEKEGAVREGVWDGGGEEDNGKGWEVEMREGAPCGDRRRCHWPRSLRF